MKSKTICFPSIYIYIYIFFFTNTLHLLTRLIHLYLTRTKFEKRSVLVAMGLLELPDLRHTLIVDIVITLLGISGYNDLYNGLPGRTLPINLIHETARRSERVDNAALSSAVSYEIPGQMMERALFCTFSR